MTRGSRGRSLRRSRRSSCAATPSRKSPARRNSRLERDPADLHNWVAARWISLEREAPVPAPPPSAPPDADRTNGLRLIERVEQDWIKGVLEASLHHRAWLELGLDWREDAVEHPWDRIVVAPDRPIQTLDKQDSITGVFDSAQHTLLVLGQNLAPARPRRPWSWRATSSRARAAATAAVPVVLALSNWRCPAQGLPRLAGGRAGAALPSAEARGPRLAGGRKAGAYPGRAGRGRGRPAHGLRRRDQRLRAGASARRAGGHLPRGGIRGARHQAAPAFGHLPAAAHARASRPLFPSRRRQPGTAAPRAAGGRGAAGTRPQSAHAERRS